jgi:alpha-mannosidase
LDVAHAYCPLPDRACTLYLDCGLYQTAIWHPGAAPDRWGFRFEGASLRLRNEEAWRVWHDWDALQQLMDRLLEVEGDRSERASHRYKRPLREISPLLRRLLRDLDRACDDFDTDGLAALSELLPGLFDRYRAEHWQPKLALAGHAHLDLVWLWPERVGARKAIHTFATTLRVMERYPDFTFTQSSPGLYDQVRERAPELYLQIRERIDQGRWEPTGALEVEADTLIPCGEALARCVVYGQRRFAALRGGELCRTAWLPDVFGYSACLPQILKLAGCQSFFTTKLTWSALTRFPHQSFLWRGPDGSEVLTHLAFTRYNGTVHLADMVGCARAYRQSDVHDELLVPRGYGDGAGGPTEEMVERAARLADLAGVPRTSWSKVEDFFDRLHQVRDELPRFQGELYLEVHRGTLTSQSRYKAAYRACELALQAREAARVVRGKGPVGYEAWRRVLFAQFHDALPGSSIGEVYAELTPELERLAERQREQARRELKGRAAGRGFTIFNPLPFGRNCLVEADVRELGGYHIRSLTSDLGDMVPVQLTPEGDRALFARELPALGSQTLSPGELGRSVSSDSQLSVTPGWLDNDLLRAEFDPEGQLRSLAFEGAPLPLEGGAGLLIAPDHPVSWDAWDIERYTLDLARPAASRLKLKVRESGPVRATLEGRSKLGEVSELTLRYQLWAGLPYLLIELEVDWREEHRLLRFEARTGSIAQTARFGCPFGSIERVQVPSRDEQEAQWEVAGSRWAAVGDADASKGLALFTEAKYGFSCRDGTLGVSLLRAPTYPDPNCDKGRHLIRLALGPHLTETTDVRLSTAAAAEALFVPALIVAGDTLAKSPFDLTDIGSLVPSWVLPAEDGDGWVLRLHEAMGKRGEALLWLPGAPRSVEMVDLLERPIAPVEPFGGGAWRLGYRPYQVVSVKVVPESAEAGSTK